MAHPNLKPVYGGEGLPDLWLMPPNELKAFSKRGSKLSPLVGIFKAVLITSFNRLGFCMNPASVDFMIRSLCP